MQVPPIRADGLQIEEHRRFQERLWSAERIAWAGFLCILLAALAGLTGGGGVLSRSTIALGPAQADVPRISRWNAADEVRVDFGAGGGSRTLALSHAFSDAFDVENVRPAPTHWAAAAAAQTLHFDVSGPGPGRVIVHVRARRLGLVRYTLAADGAAPQSVTTFILP